MADFSYRDQVDAARIIQIREICRDLPPACYDFISAITVTTGTFTRLAYAMDMRTFFHFLQSERVAFSNKPLYLFKDEDLAAVSQSDLAAYVDYLTLYYKNDQDDQSRPLKPLVNHELAIKRKLCSLRAFYEYLFMNQRVPSNVTQLIALPKVHEKPIIRLSESEMSRLLSVAEIGEKLTARQQQYQKLTAKRDYAMLSLFLGTGIRVSECVSLNIADVNLEDNAFLVTRKGGNQVMLYFPAEVAEALSAYLEERNKIEALPGHEDALFLSLQRRRITQRAVQQLVKKYAAVAAPLKPKISPHKLRSTFATNLYSATGDIYLVADVLGHSSVETTRKHYADMREEHRRNAVNYVKLSGQKETAASDVTEGNGTASENETPEET